MNVPLFGNHLGRCGQVKMRSCWARMNPNPVTGVHIKREVCTKRHTERRERRGMADRSDASLSQGTQGFAGSHQKPEEKQGTDSQSSEPPEGTKPANTLILNFWLPGPKGKISFCYFKPLCLRPFVTQPWERNTRPPSPANTCQVSLFLGIFVVCLSHKNASPMRAGAWAVPSVATPSVLDTLTFLKCRDNCYF